jgi:hypothetical protein
MISNIDPNKANMKWSPVVDNMMPCKNDNIKHLICLYAEWYRLKEDANGIANSTLPEKMREIRDKINSYDRIEVVGKFYNPASGLVEYKLIDGRFVSLDKINTYELPSVELVKIFDKEFVKELDPSKYRDEQLNKIV